MREIKFRAYDSESKEMVFFDLSDLDDGYVDRFDITKMPVMQYTGLKDKSGKEIYEGDIFVVRSLHDGDEGVWNQSRFNSGGQGAIPQLVTWDAEGCGFEFGRSTRIKYESYDFEVIGNIHENPEILHTNPKD